MRVYDLCACTRANIKISLNGRTLPLRSLDHYASLFWGPPDVDGGEAGGGVGGGRARASLTLSDPSCPARLEAVFSVSKSASFEARVCVLFLSLSLSLSHTRTASVWLDYHHVCTTPHSQKASLRARRLRRGCVVRGTCQLLGRVSSLKRTHALCICPYASGSRVPCFPCLRLRRLRKGYVCVISLSHTHTLPRSLCMHLEAVFCVWGITSFETRVCVCESVVSVPSLSLSLLTHYEHTTNTLRTHYDTHTHTHNYMYSSLSLSLSLSHTHTHTHTHMLWQGIVNGVLCSQGTHIEHLASRICDGLVQRAVRQVSVCARRRIPVCV